MDASLAYAPLKLESIVQDLLHKRVSVLILVLEFLDIFDAVGEGRLVFLVLPVLLDDYRPVRNHLGEPVGLRERKVRYARHVLDGQLGRKGTESDDMGYVIGAVVLLHILDHTVASLVIEVHVDIRHRYSLRIEETLEEEVVADRVKIGDVQAIRHT